MFRKIAFLFTCLIQIAQAQQNSKEPVHVNRLLYSVGNTQIMFTNEFCLERRGNHYLNFPYSDRIIDVYGPTSKIYLGDTASFKNHFLPPLSLAAYVTDSSVHRYERLPLKNLYISMMKKGQQKFSWQKIELPKQDDGVHPIEFSLEKMLPCEQMELTLAGPDFKPILKFIVNRLEDPIKPYVAMYMTDTSTRTAFSKFVAKNLSSNLQHVHSIDEFYQYWPNKYSAQFLNAPVAANTHLALYFRKPNPTYKDSSMEYKFEEIDGPEGTWYTTGHRIFLTGFQPGKHYLLMVRYNQLPDAVQTYRFWVPSPEHQFIGWKELVLILTVLGSMLIGFAAWLVLEKRKKHLLSLRLRSLRSELNPHFVYNALTSLQGLINRGEKELAHQYISSFSKLMRDTLKATEIESQPLALELKTLEHYLELEQLRYSFQYQIDVDPSLPLNDINVPPLMMQPLIENAVKHGMASLGEKGVIQLTVQLSEKNLILCVRDNGKIPVANESIEKGRGQGLALTRERIKLLNRLMKGRSIQLRIGKNVEGGLYSLLEFKNWCV